MAEASDDAQANLARSAGAIAAAIQSDPDALLSRLSPREAQLCRFVAEGLSTKEVAARLGLSVKTVESHRASLYRKLGIENAAGVTKFAILHGLVALEWPSVVADPE